MSKILIISHYYKHKNAMASVRAIKLAKYLNLRGHEVTVLTSWQRDNWCKQAVEPEVSETIREIYAPEAKCVDWLYKFYGAIKKRGERRAARQSIHLKKRNDMKSPSFEASQSLGFKTRIKRWLSWLFYFSSDVLENKILFHSMVKTAKREKLNGFDYVIATYPGAAAHMTGIWFKENKRCKQFIADYRDPAYNPGARDNKIESNHDKKFQDRVIKTADKIVCVSHGMANALIEQYTGKNLPLYVINNGYDAEDFMTDIKINFDNSKINFVYTGTLYHGRRTVDKLALILRRLIDEGVASERDFSFEYAGPDFQVLYDQLKTYNLESTAHDNGYVNREVSLAMQKAADAVLLLNWNDNNYRGVIPGKIYEYMASASPLIALIMGNEGYSETTRMIESGKLGVAYEEAVQESMQKLYEFIIKLISSHRSGEKIRTELDKVRQYDYGYIVEEYERCFKA